MMGRRSSCPNAWTSKARLLLAVLFISSGSLYHNHMVVAQPQAQPLELRVEWTFQNVVSYLSYVFGDTLAINGRSGIASALQVPESSVVPSEPQSYILQNKIAINYRIAYDPANVPRSGVAALQASPRAYIADVRGLEDLQVRLLSTLPPVDLISPPPSQPLAAPPPPGAPPLDIPVPQPETPSLPSPAPLLPPIFDPPLAPPPLTPSAPVQSLEPPPNIPAFPVEGQPPVPSPPQQPRAPRVPRSPRSPSATSTQPLTPPQDSNIVQDPSSSGTTLVPDASGLSGPTSREATSGAASSPAPIIAAVVIPVAVVAILATAIYFWVRKQRKFQVVDDLMRPNVEDASGVPRAGSGHVVSPHVDVDSKV